MKTYLMDGRKINNMKKYIIEIEFHEESDEFWEEITANGKSGCDELLEVIRDELQAYHPITVKITKFEDK